ncbi:FKBP-type peptidyl-prolyl cis-trans isomerase [Tenacibaculum ovolyticum]|uniref:FKBP-type peptidyl-prolyl cis-trans isomerase n=1 Tax=Tenacibaculum ovolyticum TaxID=104270 RepID=UPI0022F3B0C0|nr:FKBP-type peptidyl-prolyl cis-trans isomerase [Tenacibaculum ovolyticum]WBX77336.1 FKBP-type peptidyl-prolyl cis-trans isomerase [Tenacibaculum ovolyticum]
MKKIASLLTIISAFFSCSSEEPNFDAQNEAEIVKYIADNNLTAKKSDSGLYYVISTEGTGGQPTSNSTVTIAYKGYYLDGKVFDQNSTFKTNLQSVIRGWTEGITYFKEGGSGILLIPSKLGYGSKNYRGIPGGSVLIFDISLLKIH